MNKITKKALVLCLVGSLALEQPVYVEGASIIDTSKQITTVETVPHVLTTGTTSDLERKKIYNRFEKDLTSRQNTYKIVT